MVRKLQTWLAVGLVAVLAAVMLGQSLAVANPDRLTASLSGSEEVGDPGDDNGSGSVVVRTNRDKQRVCFDLTWSKIDAPFASHIHEGDAGVNGGVVVAFFESAAPLPATITSVAGCVRNVPRATIRAIEDDPAHFYVNVHNETFPAGAIRGQLG